MQTAIDYTCGHAPTLKRFHQSAALVRGIMGNIRSGKSVACCAEIIGRSMEQAPGNDGVRRTRWAIIRNTYGELKTTTIKTWQEWVPPELCTIVYDAPIRGVFRTKLQDGTKVEAELFFAAIDKPDDAGKVLGMELTGMWVNEAREIDLSIINRGLDRVGSYPSKRLGGCTWHGAILDTNPPDDDHWWHRLAEVESPKGWEFFRQPGALMKHPATGLWVPNPQAENVIHQTLGYNYWLEKVPGKDEDYVKVYYAGEYGMTREGKPVYPEYSDGVHCAEYLPAIPALPLYLGFDFGLTPACAWGQTTPRSRLLLLGEDCATDMGLKQFLRDVIVPRLVTEFKEWVPDKETRKPEWMREANDNEARIIVTYDPSGKSRSSTDMVSCVDILRDALGEFRVSLRPGPTNDPVIRREAVASYLTRMVDGQPAFAVAKNAAISRKGFQGRYCYERVRVSGEERYRDVPLKNFFSHIHDGIQYLAMACGGHRVQTASKSIDELLRKEGIRRAGGNATGALSQRQGEL